MDSVCPDIRAGVREGAHQDQDQAEIIHVDSVCFCIITGVEGEKENDIDTSQVIQMNSACSYYTTRSKRSRK